MKNDNQGNNQQPQTKAGPRIFTKGGVTFRTTESGKVQYLDPGVLQISSPEDLERAEVLMKLRQQNS